MQGEVGEDLLTLRLSIGSPYHFEVPTRKRKRFDEPNDKNLMVLLQARDRMIRLSSNRHGMMMPDDKEMQNLLLLCAAAVDQNNFNSATELLRQLYRNVSLSGNPTQRVAAYFTDALMDRFITKNSSFYSSITADPSSKDQFSAFTSLYLVSPYYQFAHLTATQAIFEAFEEEEHWNGGCLHVIDFDVSYGIQWPSLIESLSYKATNHKPISLRITGFGRSVEELRDTEKSLSSFASGCRNLSFEFEGRLRGEKGRENFLQVKKNATVAVNLVFYLHTLRSYSDICTTLMQTHALNPSVVTLVEKEGSHSGVLSRFKGYLHYFAAMFDSLDDCLPARNEARLKIEKNCLGREIKHAVAVKNDQGEKGCGYERLETWKAIMERYRFEGVRMSSWSVSQAKLLLKINSYCSAMDDHGTGKGFQIFERDGGKAISLGWEDRYLITATAWRRS